VAWSLIHQPLGGTQGQASDIEIEAREIIRIKQTLSEILARHTGRDIDEIIRDSDRNKWMNADESLAYGLVDKVLERAPIK